MNKISILAFIGLLLYSHSLSASGVLEPYGDDFDAIDTLLVKGNAAGAEARLNSLPEKVRVTDPVGSLYPSKDRIDQYRAIIKLLAAAGEFRTQKLLFEQSAMKDSDYEKVEEAYYDFRRCFNLPGGYLHSQSLVDLVNSLINECESSLGEISTKKARKDKANKQLATEEAAKAEEQRKKDDEVKAEADKKAKDDAVLAELVELRKRDRAEEDATARQVELERQKQDEAETLRLEKEKIDADKSKVTWSNTLPKSLKKITELDYWKVVLARKGAESFNVDLETYIKDDNFVISATISDKRFLDKHSSTMLVGNQLNLGIAYYYFYYLNTWVFKNTDSIDRDVISDLNRLNHVYILKLKNGKGEMQIQGRMTNVAWLEIQVMQPIYVTLNGYKTVSITGKYGLESLWGVPGLTLDSPYNKLTEQKMAPYSVYKFFNRKDVLDSIPK